MHFAPALQQFIHRKRGRTEFLTQEPYSFFARLSLRYVAAALLLFAAVGGVWSVMTLLQLRRELDRDRQAFNEQLNENRVVTERMQSQYQALETALAEITPGTAQVLLTLIPGVSRSAAAVPTLNMASNAKLVQFSLVLLEDNFEAYRVSLSDASGQEQWTVDRLKSTANGQGSAVIFHIPAALLSTGDYTFSLAGRSGSQPSESISSFYFRALRQ
jgi:hypothetical protein